MEWLMMAHPEREIRDLDSRIAQLEELAYLGGSEEGSAL